MSVATKSEVATTGKRTAFHYVGPNALIISSQSCTISIQPCRKDCVQCSTVFFTRNIASLSPAPSELCACIHLCASIHHLDLDNPPLLRVQPHCRIKIRETDAACTFSPVVPSKSSSSSFCFALSPRTSAMIRNHDGETVV